MATAQITPFPTTQIHSHDILVGSRSKYVCVHELEGLLLQSLLLLFISRS